MMLHHLLFLPAALAAVLPPPLPDQHFHTESIDDRPIAKKLSPPIRSELFEPPLLGQEEDVDSSNYEDLQVEDDSLEWRSSHRMMDLGDLLRRTYDPNLILSNDMPLAKRGGGKIPKLPSGPLKKPDSPPPPVGKPPAPKPADNPSKATPKPGGKDDKQKKPGPAPPPPPKPAANNNQKKLAPPPPPKPGGSNSQKKPGPPAAPPKPAAGENNNRKKPSSSNPPKPPQPAKLAGGNNNQKKPGVPPPPKPVTPPSRQAPKNSPPGAPKSVNNASKAPPKPAKPANNPPKLPSRPAKPPNNPSKGPKPAIKPPRAPAPKVDKSKSRPANPPTSTPKGDKTRPKSPSSAPASKGDKSKPKSPGSAPAPKGNKSKPKSPTPAPKGNQAKAKPPVSVPKAIKSSPKPSAPSPGPKVDNKSKPKSDNKSKPKPLSVPRPNSTPNKAAKNKGQPPKTQSPVRQPKAKSPPIKAPSKSSNPKSNTSSKPGQPKPKTKPTQTNLKKPSGDRTGGAKKPPGNPKPDKSKPSGGTRAPSKKNLKAPRPGPQRQGTQPVDNAKKSKPQAKVGDKSRQNKKGGKTPDGRPKSEGKVKPPNGRKETKPQAVPGKARGPVQNFSSKNKSSRLDANKKPSGAPSGRRKSPSDKKGPQGKPPNRQVPKNGPALRALHNSKAPSREFAHPDPKLNAAISGKDRSLVNVGTKAASSADKATIRGPSADKSSGQSGPACKIKRSLNGRLFKRCPDQNKQGSSKDQTLGRQNSASSTTSDSPADPNPSGTLIMNGPVSPNDKLNNPEGLLHAKAVKGGTVGVHSEQPNTIVGNQDGNKEKSYTDAGQTKGVLEKEGKTKIELSEKGSKEEKAELTNQLHRMPPATPDQKKVNEYRKSEGKKPIHESEQMANAEDPFRAGGSKTNIDNRYVGGVPNNNSKKSGGLENAAISKLNKKVGGNEITNVQIGQQNVDMKDRAQNEMVNRIGGSSVNKPLRIGEKINDKGSYSDQSGSKGGLSRTDSGMSEETSDPNAQGTSAQGERQAEKRRKKDGNGEGGDKKNNLGRRELELKLRELGARLEKELVRRRLVKELRRATVLHRVVPVIGVW